MYKRYGTSLKKQIVCSNSSMIIFIKTIINETFDTRINETKYFLNLPRRSIDQLVFVPHPRKKFLFMNIV